MSRLASRFTLTLLAAAVSTPAFSAGANHVGGCAPTEMFSPGTITTPDRWEWRLSFSPSRLLAYWASSEGWFPATREATIVFSQWRPWGWSLPQVASFSGEWADMDPAFAPHGLVLFFSSNRPVNGEQRGDMDLWMVRRTLSGWSEPTHLGENVNSPGDELYASIDWFGNLYFASDRDGPARFDIFRSRPRPDGSFGPAERLGPEVNTPDHMEYNPEISPDGRTLLFASLNRADSYGYGDLYVSRRQGEGFTTAANLGPCVNTEADEFHPTVLWERKMLFFARDFIQPGSNSDFYHTRLRLPRGND